MVTSWSMRGTVLVACNCDYGCPCNFQALPTQGKCEGQWTWHVDAGTFDDVDLSGLTFTLSVDWPGPIHHGDGEGVLLIDERADEAQRDALVRILRGEETEPGATIFNVFAATFERMHEPAYLPIAFEADPESRTGSIRIEGVIETRVEPIRNPITGAEHRARVVLPGGFEYREAEYASGDTRATGAISLDWSKRHAHLATLDLSTHGIA
jgi:hypothetical protein